MARPAWLKAILAAGNEFHFVKQEPWKHNLLNLGALLLVFALFGGVMAMGGVIEQVWLYVPLAAVSMGCLFFSLFVLVIHECSHCMFVLSKNRETGKKANHAIGTIMGDLLFTNSRKPTHYHHRR